MIPEIGPLRTNDLEYCFDEIPVIGDVSCRFIFYGLKVYLVGIEPSKVRLSTRQL